MHARRVVQAVASEQAGGISYHALWQENERLKAENAALWHAWAEAEDLREAQQREVAGSGAAMGLTLQRHLIRSLTTLVFGAAVTSPGWLIAEALQSLLELGSLPPRSMAVPTGATRA